MWHTYGTWLPGDPRGFRDRSHRIHSSGDYKHPPPRGEHTNLHAFNRQQYHGEVVLRTAAQRLKVRDALVGALLDTEANPLIVAICRVHVHWIAELPVERDAFEKLIKRAKIESSKAIEHKSNGRGWARGHTNVLIKTPAQRTSCYFYVRGHQGKNASVWTYKDVASDTD